MYTASGGAVDDDGFGGDDGFPEDTRDRKITVMIRQPTGTTVDVMSLSGALSACGVGCRVIWTCACCSVSSAGWCVFPSGMREWFVRWCVFVLSCVTHLCMSRRK